MSTCSRRQFLATSAAAAAAMCGVSAGAQEEKPPNIIIIFTDDQGYNDLSCFGSKTIKTPNIDRLAQEGMKFTHFYVAAPVCTPSRAALMTGCYPQRNSMAVTPRVNEDGSTRPGLVLFPDSIGYGLHPDEITIADMLRGKGYATGCVGKWHLGMSDPFLPTNQGFDSYFGIPYSNDMNPAPVLRNAEVFMEEADQDILTEQYTEEAVNFIKTNKDKPFFLYMPHSMPHTPLHVSDQFEGKSAGGLYGDVIQMIDWSVGEILKTLDELMIAENTLVIYTSDNGPWLSKGSHGGSAEPLRAGKGTCYEGGMREPCVMRWPKRIPAGTECSELATALDMLPTIAAITGATTPGDRTIDGVDVSMLFDGNPDVKSPRETFYYYKGNGLEAVRHGDWKLIFPRKSGEEYPYGAAPPDFDRRVDVPEELYNVRDDIGETRNVIADHPDIVEKIHALADTIRADLGDARTGVEGAGIRPIGDTRKTTPA